jgi:spectrin alpha
VFDGVPFLPSRYNLSVEDVELWLSTVERLAGSSDLGKDLLSVQSLIKKHKAVESDIVEHRGAVEKLAGQAADFTAAGHFDAAAISERCAAISTRYVIFLVACCGCFSDWHVCP